MSSTEKLMVELIRRGATLLKESCPKCGGLMVKYKGKVICPTCSKAKTVKEIEEELISKGALEPLISEIIEKRVHELIKSIEGLPSVKKEKEVVELILLYYQLLNEVRRVKEKGNE